MRTRVLRSCLFRAIKNNIQFYSSVLVLIIIAFTFTRCSDDDTKTSTLNLQPAGSIGKDAVFSKLVPNNNYGDIEDIHLYVNYQGAPGQLNVNRVAIEFDLSPIPERSKIDRAYLSLYFNSTSKYGYSHSGETDFIIQRITAAWNESTITWNTQPAVSSTNEVYVEGADAENQDFQRIDVTQLVQDIVNNKDNSFGLLLKFKTEEASKLLLLASSDHTDESKRPKLSVQYTSE